MGLSLVAVFLYAGTMSTSGIVAAQTGSLVRHHLAAVVHHLHDLDGRRDQPCTVRPPRGRGRTGRWFPHRVLIDQVRVLLPRRVHQHGDRLDAGDHDVPRRLACAVAAVALGRRQPGLLAGAVVPRQGACSSSSSSSGCAARCPRMRYDQFMALGWKWLIPASLIWILAVGTIRAISLENDGPIDRNYLIAGGVIALVLFVLAQLRAGQLQGRELDEDERSRSRVRCIRRWLSGAPHAGTGEHSWLA